MENKVIGYLLIAVGVLVIFLTAFSVYNVFVNKAAPINIVSQETLFGLKSEGASALDALNISPSSLSYLVNLSFHLLFAGFLINVGFRLGSLGTMLARPIVVDLQAKGLPKKEPQEKTKGKGI
jgi:hypothetical protein